MWKRLLVILLLLCVARCGKPTPAIAGIDLPPSDNTGDISQSSTNSNNNSVAPDEGVKILSAPLVLLRGDIPQYQTLMNSTPGA